MKEAFNAVKVTRKVALKFNKNITVKGINMWKFFDRDFYLDTYKSITNPAGSSGYKNRIVRRNRHFNIE